MTRVSASSTGGMFSVVSEPKKSRFANTLSLELKSLDFLEEENYHVRVRPEYFTGAEKSLTHKELKNTQSFRKRDNSYTSLGDITLLWGECPTSGFWEPMGSCLSFSSSTPRWLR